MSNKHRKKSLKKEEKKTKRRKKDKKKERHVWHLIPKKDQGKKPHQGHDFWGRLKKAPKKE